MLHCIRRNGAAVYLRPIDDNQTEIVSLAVEDDDLRRQGRGSALLREVLDAAPHGHVYILEPSPTSEGDNALEYRDLVAWYEKHGFKYDYVNSIMHWRSTK